MSAAVERRLLQLVIALGGLVPVAAGLAGALRGGAMTGESLVAPDIDSHVRYLSGLLLGIGLAFWASIPGIERHTGRIRLLTGLVAVGGLIRLAGFVMHGMPSLPMRAAVLMELVVTPAICLWQARIARRRASPSGVDRS